MSQHFYNTMPLFLVVVDPNMIFISVGISIILTVNLSTYQLLKKERRLILEKSVLRKGNKIIS